MKYSILLILVTFSCSTIYSKTNLYPIQPSHEDSTPPYALVAGGSRGIGFSIAEALAKRNFNLILIARHQDALQIAKEYFQTTYHINVIIWTFDLSNEASSRQIANLCNEEHIQLRVLCNVAGLGGITDYLSIPVDSVQYMIRLNIESCMTLTQALLPLLEINSPSYILNVASMAAFAPIPQKNVYSATKSAVLFFSYALRYQLKNKNITVSCLCPGPVFTKPSIEKDTKDKLGGLGMRMAVPAKRVGEYTVHEMLKGKMIIIPGGWSKLVAACIRFLPPRWMASLYDQLS